LLLLKPPSQNVRSLVKYLPWAPNKLGSQAISFEIRPATRKKDTHRSSHRPAHRSSVRLSRYIASKFRIRGCVRADSPDLSLFLIERIRWSRLPRGFRSCFNRSGLTSPSPPRQNTRSCRGYPPTSPIFLARWPKTAQREAAFCAKGLHLPKERFFVPFVHPQFGRASDFKSCRPDHPPRHQHLPEPIPC
jgi:hypothetical protein